MSRGYVIYMPHFAVRPLVCPYAIGVCRHNGGNIYISAWGFGVARFDKQGNILGASNREASDRASRFFYVPLTCGNEKHS